MAIKKVFKSSIPSCKYIFANGKAAVFIGGKYLTDFESEIRELEQEIKSGHPHIYVDEKEAEIDTEQLDPIEQIKKKAIAEYLAQQAAATNPENDMGNTEKGKLEGIASSKTIAALAAGSNQAAAPSAPVAATVTPGDLNALVASSKTK